MWNVFGWAKEETCLILGNTMDAMPFIEDSADARTIRHSVHFAIVRAIENGLVRFVIPLEYGVGLWAAESILALKRSIPFIELRIVEAPETESEGELGEHGFDSLMERMAGIRHKAKSFCVVPDDMQDWELLELIQPGLLLLFSDAGDEDMAELTEIVKQEGYRAQWHTWKHVASPRAFLPEKRKDGEIKSTL